MKNTSTQIANMKNQTIGVEIEMTRITRSRAAEIAAKLFESYIDPCGQDLNVEFMGGSYRTWRTWDSRGREWKFSYDSSIIGREEEKCELITPILEYTDIALLLELLKRLRQAGAVSDAEHGCGIHVHIGAADHTPQSLRNLVNIMAGHEELLVDAIGIDRSGNRYGYYCKPVNPAFLGAINALKPQAMEDLANIWYAAYDEDIPRSRHYHPSRYHMLNLHAVFTKGTVEFRMFQFDEHSYLAAGGICGEQLKAYIQLCLAMNQLAKDLKYASPKPPQTENPKYAMRTWLLRMGFIGSEFADARNFLTMRLAGNSAFRSINVA